MAVVAWLLATGVVSLLTLGWWIVVPFYLGSYSTGKPVTGTERMITLVAGFLLAAAWWYGVLGAAPFFATHH
jgi:hypothetical protein